MPDNLKSFKAKANEFEFIFTQEMLDSADIIKTGPTEYNVIIQGRSVNARIIETGHQHKDLKIEVEGESFTIQIKDPLDLMLDTMGFNNVSSKQIKEIKAPMPGLVLDISVAEGQELNEGDRVLILEAMKMENSIVMHAHGKIKKISVTKGQAVEKNQVLVELE